MCPVGFPGFSEAMVSSCDRLFAEMGFDSPEGSLIVAEHEIGVLTPFRVLAGGGAPWNGRGRL